MPDPKVISLQQYKKYQKIKRYKEKILRILKNLKQKLQQKLQGDKKMIFLVIIVSIFLGSFLWNHFVENPSYSEVQIPKSNNIIFNNTKPIPMTTAQVADEFYRNEGKPILLYLYTTWCSSCAKQFPSINEVAREFQNTDLKIIALAVDRNLNPNELQSHLLDFGDIYAQPRYLSFKDGFIEFLKKKNISYQGRIPYTILISQNGEIATKFIGSKSHNYLRNKIIKELY